MLVLRQRNKAGGLATTVSKHLQTARLRFSIAIWIAMGRHTGDHLALSERKRKEFLWVKLWCYGQ